MPQAPNDAAPRDPDPNAPAPGPAPSPAPGTAPGVEAALRLRRAAEDMDWVMRFPLRSAPGLVFVGARSDAARLLPELAGRPGLLGAHAGGGESQSAALAACLGEAAEFLSQFERKGDLLPPDHGLEILDPAPDWSPPWRPPSPDLVEIRRLSDDAPFACPADRLLRRPGSGPGPEAPAPPVRLGLGCAAGPTLAHARLNAVLELVERDAAALWWRGGAPPRPIDPTSPGLAAAFARIGAWRGEHRDRRMWVADLTTDLGIPVAAVFAADAAPEAETARPARLTIGVAARLTLAEALLSAAREAIQGELALDLLAERRAAHGDGVVTEGDRALLARAALDPARDPRLIPRGAPRRGGGIEDGEIEDGPSRGDTPDSQARAGLASGEMHQHDTHAQRESADRSLARLVAHLAARGHHVYSADLTRPRPGLPVAWACAPSLQPDPASIETPRLRQARRRFGGARGWDGSALQETSLW